MKKILITLAVVVMLFSINMTAFAQVNVTLTYTADNEITGLWYRLGGTVIGLPLGSGAAWWPTVDIITGSLDYGPTHEIIWGIQNWGSPSSGNPGGFLAEISPAAALYPPSSSALSDVSWDVFVDYGSNVEPSDLGTLAWTSATEYGANNGSTIWNTVNGGPLAGIDGAAQWIWGPDNFADFGAPGENDMVYVRANVHVVPEPGTMLLLGSGLLGLGIFARFRRKKS